MKADGRSNNGGARAGAGRKPKVVEDDLHKLFKRCVTKKDREEILALWVQDAKSVAFNTRHKARTTLWNYLFGKPVERHEVTGKDGGPVKSVGMTFDEWKKRADGRAAQAAEAMADFEGDDA